MKLIKILEQHRAHYIKHFFECSKSCDGSNEVLLDQKSDDPVELYRLYRFDCLEKKEDGNYKIIEYNNDSHLCHPEISFTLNSMEIELNPIYWNGIEIDVFGFNEKWEKVHGWIIKWIDSNDKKEIEPIGSMSGLIHNFQRPEITTEKIQLAIDFGTANTIAMTELLNILQENNTYKIRIHSDTMLADE